MPSSSLAERAGRHSGRGSRRASTNPIPVAALVWRAHDAEPSYVLNLCSAQFLRQLLDDWQSVRRAR